MSIHANSPRPIYFDDLFQAYLGGPPLENFTCVWLPEGFEEGDEVAGLCLTKTYRAKNHGEAARKFFEGQLGRSGSIDQERTLIVTNGGYTKGFTASVPMPELKLKSL
jgi:hypothetical protein